MKNPHLFGFFDDVTICIFQSFISRFHSDRITIVINQVLLIAVESKHLIVNLELICNYVSMFS